MNQMVSMDILKKTTIDKKIVYILYDHECKICTSVKNMASGLLKTGDFFPIAYGLKPLLGRELISSDEFGIIINGEEYKSHFAWMKIFENSKGIVRYIAYLSKSKYTIKIAELIYKFLVKYKRFFFLRKKGCNCKKPV